MFKKTKTPIERFNDKVAIQENGCHNWIAYCNAKGYGVFRSNNKIMLAHRFSWEDANKCIVPTGQYILHKCDNPACVNPEHLYVGDQFDNMKDMLERGRAHKAIGEQSGVSVLTVKQVKDIKNQLKNGVTVASIVKTVGISRHLISDIKSNRTWRHLTV